MARRTEKETLKRDNLLVDFLRKHKGVENAITAYEICDYLSQNGCVVKPRSLNGLITRLKMERTIPICYVRSKGYFWASCKGEILNTINDMLLMIGSLKEHVKFLESFIVN